MDIFYESDWHIHTNASYDAELPVTELLEKAEEGGIKQFGITDHVNYPFMLPHLEKSRKQFLQHKKEGFHFGVELTTLPLSQYNFALKHSADAENSKTWFVGYIPPIFKKDGIALSLSEQALYENKVEYVVAGAHWAFCAPLTRNMIIKNYHAQQMFLARHKSVDIIAHPWWVYYGKYLKNDIMTGPWFDDFDRIPYSMHDEFAAAAFENNKMVELNTDFFVSSCYTEKFKKQYAEYICYLYEKGIPITIGSDLHSNYTTHHNQVREYMEPLGFTKDSFCIPKFRQY